MWLHSTVLTLSDVNIKQLNYNMNNVNKELMKINHWMKMNYTKTKFIIISNKKNADKCEIKLGEHIIKQVKQIKYLGVNFDDGLS